MGSEILPDGVSPINFQRALKEFAAAIGNDNVFVTSEALAAYRKIQLPVDENTLAPSAALAPASNDEIARILEIANAYKIPLWVISTGRNFGYGTAAPASRGQVVLDLRRMNRIIGVDADLCTALVEPGVTYGQLQAYLDEHDLPLCLDMPGAGPIAGPLGNSLERGVGYTPYGDHWNNVCGLEVMLADGTTFKTGMGELPNQGSWQVYRYGYGPYLDGMFSQSNFGIVTKMGFWLMPRPDVARSYMSSFSRSEDIGPLIEVMRGLKLKGIMTSVTTLAHAGMLLIRTTTRAEVKPSGGPMSSDEMVEAARKLGFDTWNLPFTLTGTEGQVKAAEEVVLAEIRRIGGKVMPLPADPRNVGRSTLEAYKEYNWIGGGGSTWFSPVAPARAADAEKQFEMGKRIMARYGQDYTGAFILMGRDMHHVLHLLFDRTNPEERDRANACWQHLLREFSAAGYGTYRTPTAYMDQVAELFGPQLRDVNRRIKRALDPNGILSPGKSGIRA